MADFGAAYARELKNFPSRACRSRIACSLVLLLISPPPPVVKPDSKNLPGPAGDGRGDDLSKSRRRVGSAAGVGHHLRLVYLSRAAPLARTALGADWKRRSPEKCGASHRRACYGLSAASHPYSLGNSRTMHNRRPEEYLKDTTGNRRFCPASAKRFDLKAIRRDREQLWAEAARGAPDNEGAFASNATPRALLPPIGAGTGLSFGSS